MLLQLLDYIKREKMVSLESLARLFHIDPSALEPMLARLIHKKLITPLTLPQPCASPCKQCHRMEPKYYTIAKTPRHRRT